MDLIHGGSQSRWHRSQSSHCNGKVFGPQQCCMNRCHQLLGVPPRKEYISKTSRNAFWKDPYMKKHPKYIQHQGDIQLSETTIMNITCGWWMWSRTCLSGSGAESVKIFDAEDVSESVKVDAEGMFCLGSVKCSCFALQVAWSEGVNSGILSNFFNVAHDLMHDPARRCCILDRELEKMERQWGEMRKGSRIFWWRFDIKASGIPASPVTQMVLKLKGLGHGCSKIQWGQVREKKLFVLLL